MVKHKPGFLTVRGGKLRGKKIPIPDTGVRPTTDKMREQIFNLIDQYFRLPDGRARLLGAHVLDAFAGTSALGLEALSRGAGKVIAWDINHTEMTGLKNLGLKAVQQSALTPPLSSQAMDLIFLDPPYGKGLIARTLIALQKTGWLDAQSLVIAEAEAGLLPSEGFKVLAQKSAGQSQIWLMQSNNFTEA